MKYLIVLILCVLATTKMSIQGAFAKKNINNIADVLCFNGLMFLFSAIIFSYDVIGCPWQVWLYASLGAVFSVVYQISYTKALIIGNVSLTVLIVNFALIINILVSYLFFGDSISGVRFVGILLTVIVFLLSVDKKEGKSKKVKLWVTLALVAMLCSAAGSIIQKVLSESSFANYNRAYTSASYFVAAILTYLAYITLKSKGERKTFKIGKTAIIFSMLTGVCLALYVMLNIYALSVVEGTFLFPTYSGGFIILSSVAGVILFKDKLNIKQILGLVIGVIAIVLMNF